VDWATLSALSQDGSTLRKTVFAWMRDPDDTDVKWDKMPRGLGDDYTVLSNSPATPSPRSFLSLTRVQYAMLREWAADNFTTDWPGVEPTFTSNPNPTPDDLDYAAAESCVGGPFYPGIEVSWLIRAKDLYSEPFRLKIAPGPENAAAPLPAPLSIGALTFRPGFFSQQMALPWQADFYDCQKELWDDPDGNEYLFMWWTAQRPDDVFPSGIAKQVRWVRTFDDPEKSQEKNDNDDGRFNKMVSRWFELKFVSVQNGGHFEEEP
jgi:hypothetical protein